MMTAGSAAYPEGWVKESAFGDWFLNTRIWANHVLKLSLDDLERLMRPRLERYPTILDVGCGHGHSLYQLDQRFHPDRIIAVDVDPRACRWGAPRVASCRCQVDFIINNARSLEIPDACADMIFCHQTLHHVIEQEMAVKEFHRVLNPGGVLLFAESCRRYINSWLIRALFSHPMDVQKTDEEYISLLRDAGFVFSPEAVSRPFLWWSRADLGLLEKLGWTVPQEREETLLYLVAHRSK